MEYMKCRSSLPEATAERNGVMCAPFDDLSPEEQTLAHLVVLHWRIAKQNQKKWIALLPQIQDGFDFPIPVPSQMPIHTNGTNGHSSRFAQSVNGESRNGTTPTNDTTATDDAILDVLAKADSPIKAMTIALRAKVNLNSYFRERLSILVGKGDVIRTLDNLYRLATDADEGTEKTVTRTSAKCRQTIVEILKDQKRRMTSGEVQQCLDDKGFDWSLSTVQKALLDLANEGMIDNDRGEGYGLIEHEGHDETVVDGAAPKTCMQALLHMFRSTRLRRSAGTAHLWLNDHGFDYSINTVQTYLTNLVREGELDRQSDMYGKGYGLVDWSKKPSDGA